MGFRRIDVGDADVLALKPDGVAVDHAIKSAARVAIAEVGADALATEYRLRIAGALLWKLVPARTDQQPNRNRAAPQRQVASPDRLALRLRPEAQRIAAATTLNYSEA